MKNNFKFYITIWAIFLVLFNIIAFVSVGWSGVEKYTASFWIGYVFITLAFFGQLICSYLAFKEDNLKKLFYNLPLITISYSGLIMSFVFGALCMIISPLPYWVGILLCAILLAIYAIALVKARAAAAIVEDVDQKIKVQTFFIKSLTVDAESLIAHSKTDEIKTETKKVYEAIRYSDPMSNDALSGIESQISIRFSAFSEAVEANDIDKVKSLSSEILILANDRNKKCKMLK